MIQSFNNSSKNSYPFLMLAICPTLFCMLLKEAKDTKAQRGYVICSAMHSPEVAKPEQNLV